MSETPKLELVIKNEVEKIAEEKPKPVAPVVTAKKKINKADYQFKSQTDQLLVKMPGDIDGLAFRMTDLENCTVVILDHTAQITVDRCKNTKFFIGPIKASIFFRDCSDCDITVCCSQFRCRDLVNSRVNVFTPNDPIVESSSSLTFGPFNLKYPLLREHAEAADLLGTFVDDDGVTQNKVNKWKRVFDFTKNEDGQLNFSLIKPEEFKVVNAQDLVEDRQFETSGADPEFMFELPVEFGGSLANDGTEAAKGGMMAFDIKTDAAEAQRLFELSYQTPTDEVKENESNSLLEIIGSSIKSSEPEKTIDPQVLQSAIDKVKAFLIEKDIPVNTFLAPDHLSLAEAEFT